MQFTEHTYQPIRNILSRAMTKINKCHRCGATSYKPVIKRDESGAMNPSGESQCVGCKLIFTEIDEWRVGPSAAQGAQKQDQVHGLTQGDEQT
jgi:hypothetical protein